MGWRPHTVKCPENEVSAKPNRPPPQYLSCWQAVVELWRKVNMQTVFGLTNFNVLLSTSPEWGIPNSGGAIDNVLRCNSNQFAKVLGSLLRLIEQVILLRKPLMQLIEPKFATLYGTTQRYKLRRHSV